MTSDNRLSRHVHSFFHDYLTLQRNVSPHTLLSYRDTIKLFLTFASRQLSTPVVDLSLDNLTADLVLAFLEYLEQERANRIATRNTRLAALHAFFRHVGAHDPLSLEQCHRIVAIPAKRGDSKAVHYLEREELQAILSEIDRGRPQGRRDYALLTLTYQTGARVSEVVALRACDLQLEGPATVRLWGKGRKERTLPLWEHTALHLRALLEEREVDPRSAQPVFVNRRGQPLTRWGFRYVLEKHVHSVAKRDPAQPSTSKHVHPHLLRHTAAMHMLQAGVDPNVIRDVLGHASTDTTWRYVRINIEMKREAIESYAPTASRQPPLWQRDNDLLTFLENLGKQRSYVEPIRP
jgi:site-specific recombinase XerD